MVKNNAGKNPCNKAIAVPRTKPLNIQFNILELIYRPLRNSITGRIINDAFESNLMFNMPFESNKPETNCIIHRILGNKSITRFLLISTFPVIKIAINQMPITIADSILEIGITNASPTGK